jgi:hypothetical protein
MGTRSRLFAQKTMGTDDEDVGLGEGVGGEGGSALGGKDQAGAVVAALARPAGLDPATPGFVVRSEIPPLAVCRSETLYIPFPR